MNCCGTSIMYARASRLSGRCWTIKVQKYSLEELFRKKLLIMLPFYLFRYEKEFAEMEREPERRQKLLADVRVMEARLEAMRPGKLGYAAEHVAEFVDYVSRHLLEGYEQTSQEVSSVMGGKLIETKAYKAYLEGQADGEAKGEARGEARGEAKGEAKGLASAVRALMKNTQKSAQEAMDMLSVPAEKREAVAALL